MLSSSERKRAAVGAATLAIGAAMSVTLLTLPIIWTGHARAASASCQAYTCPSHDVRNVNVTPSVMIVYWGWPTGYPDYSPGSLLACGADDFPSHNRPALESLVREIGATRWLNTLSQYGWDPTQLCGRRSAMTLDGKPSICPPTPPKIGLTGSEPRPIYVQIDAPLPNVALPPATPDRPKRPAREAFALEVPPLPLRGQSFPPDQNCGPIPPVDACLSAIPMPSITGRNSLDTESAVVDRVHDCMYGSEGVFGDTIYILALPYGVRGFKTGADGSDSFTCGAHFTTPKGVPFIEQQYFSGVDKCFAFNLGPAETAASAVTSTAFHEIAEAILNPIVDEPYGGFYHGWGALPNTAGQEVGDLPCQDRTLLFQAPISVPPYHTWLQPLWSNAASAEGGGCVQSFLGNRDFDIFMLKGTDLYHSAGGSAWEDWGSPTAPKPITRPSAVSGSPTYSPNSNENHVFVADARGDVWERLHSNGSDAWVAWGNAATVVSGRPVAVAPRTNRLDVFVVDEFMGQLRWNSRTDGDLNVPAWTEIGFPGGYRGTLKSSPAAVSSTPLREDVFATTYNGDLWHTFVVSGDWSTEHNGWDQVSWPVGFSGPKGDPDAASWGDKHWDLLMFDTNNKLWRYTVDGDAPSGGDWSQWPAPPVVSSDPSIAALGEGRLVATVFGADCTIYESTWTRRDGYSEWTSPGGCASKGPSLSTKW